MVVVITRGKATYLKAVGVDSIDSIKRRMRSIQNLNGGMYMDKAVVP